jgi:CRP-like cAMP-binding protein
MAQSLIDAIPIFSVLSQDERDALAGSATKRDFGAAAEIVSEGDSLSSLMIVRSGIVIMKKGDDEIARLAPGDFFGEEGFLAGTKEKHGLQALTRVTVFEIDQTAFAPLLRERSELAEDLALHLANREAIGENSGVPTIQHERRRLDLLDAIRSIFRMHREYSKP